MPKKIKIDKEKCVGCGLCVTACHESVIGMVDGKATVLNENYCDGLGNCLPVCPVKAISFEGVEEEVKPLACGCPGMHSKMIERDVPQPDAVTTQAVVSQAVATHLNQWPVQIKLVPVNAPYFQNSKLLIAADCCAYAYGNFHNEYMKNRITIIGCPKLDEGDYTEKLTDIIKTNELKTIVVTRMSVPCCAGIENAVKNALLKSGKMIPFQIVTISTDGKIIDI